VSKNVHEAELLDKRLLASGVWEYLFGLRPRAPLPFRPGQFISLRVAEDDDGRAVLRSYSLASPPGRAEFSVILKLVDGGVASRWFDVVAVGETVRFTGPMGFFVLELAHVGDVVFAATGVGIAPVLPMLEETLARDESGRVVLYWGNRSPDDLFWRAELEALAARFPRFSYQLYISGDAPEWTGERGRITGAVVRDLPSFTRPTFYLVGNGAMIRDLRGQLVEAGVDRKRQIRNEAFFG
jgi:ferredoxin-NADP reductase